MEKETDLYVQEAQRVPNIHMIIKMAKIRHKERILKAAQEKQQVTYKGTPVRLSADFSAQILQARREWHDIFKVMEERDLQP